MRTTVKILAISTMLLLLTVIASVPQAIAKPQYKAAIDVAYGNGLCIDCHADPNGGKSLTDYGSKFKSQPAYENNSVMALRAIGAPPAVQATVAEAISTVATPISTTVIPSVTGVSTKSPGFDIIGTIGIMSTMYILRRRKTGR